MSPFHRNLPQQPSTDAGCSDAWFGELAARTEDPNVLLEAILERGDFAELLARIAWRFAGIIHGTAPEDLVQEFGLRILEAFRRGAHQDIPVGRLHGFLATVCIRTAIDAYRASQRLCRRALQLDYEQPDRRGDGPEDRMMQMETQDKVREALAQLPEPNRTIVQLRLYEGWDYRKIAAATGLQDATVRQRYHRSLDSLREYLERLYDEGAL